MKKQKKRARIVIRNLSFQVCFIYTQSRNIHVCVCFKYCYFNNIFLTNIFLQATEDNLKEFFSQYGEIDEIKILTKPDGKQTGVAFVQFNVVQNAAKAIHHANMQSLLNRPMIVDWAVPKNKFSENNIDVKPEIKTESTDENKVHDTSEITVIDNSEDENSEVDTESNRYLKTQIVCVSIDPIYIFFRILLFYYNIFSK